MYGNQKPGRKPGGRRPNRFARDYERWGLSQGYTVAEWEAVMGFPPYTIYPMARKAKSMRDRGYYMYKNATEEEKALMELARTKKGRRGLKKKIMEKKRELDAEGT